MHVFDESVAFERLGKGCYGAELDGTWWVDFGPNGGFLAALILSGLKQEVDPARHPLSLHIHYPGRARQGPVEMEVHVEREGRSMTFVTGRLKQEGEILSTAQASFTAPRQSESFSDVPMPEVTPADEIPAVEVPPDRIPRFSQNFDYRIALGAFPFTEAEHAVFGAWLRLKEPRPVDDLALAMYADACFPAAFTMASKAFPIPTMDFAIHFRHPADRVSEPGEWCLGRFESRHAGHGYVEEDGLVWAADGTLLLQSRQMAIYGRGRPERISYEVPPRS